MDWRQVLRRGSNRIGGRSVRFVIVAPFLLLGLTACGVDRGDLVEAVQVNNAESGTEVDTTQAECLVDKLLDRYEIDQLETELAKDPLDQAFEEAQFRDMFACGLDGNVDDQIAEQLTANGVSAEDAPCVSDAIVKELTDDDIDVLLSGEITGEFYEKFYMAMDSCGAIDQ